MLLRPQLTSATTVALSHLNFTVPICRGVARPGHTRATARASSYFALPSAAFPAIKMAYKL